MEKAIEQLTWYRDMGVEQVISEKPVNHLEAQPEAKPKAPKPKPEKPIAQGVQALRDRTHKEASESKDRDTLKQHIEAFKELSICKTATNTVFSDGNATSKVMLIGEAPGADEDRYGIPFCGVSGKLLDQMLKAIGLTREENCYISNTLFWRPPGNRRPTPEELTIIRPYVERHISLIKPELLILVGGTAVTSLLQEDKGISKIRGKWYDYENEFLDAPIKTTAIFHPSYLLRSPGQKKAAWQDLLRIQAHLEETNIL